MARRPGTAFNSTLNFGGDIASRRKNLGLNFANLVDQRLTREQEETERKFREVDNRNGHITINGQTYKTKIEDMEQLGELGSGTCGQVVRMLHKPSNHVVAVKQMRRSSNNDENKRIIMDLEVVLRSHDCQYIVKCLGYFVTDSDVWICMEMMSTCMDKLLKRLKQPIPEIIVGKVAMATVKALHYLKEKHDVIHRDVKPSNILLDELGNVKLCDFGISGRLVDSKAKTRQAGCTAYMAPERIEPPNKHSPTYDIRADVWSVGITMVELATGKFPYENCQTDFEVLTKILKNDPPRLADSFTPEFRSFVEMCLKKNFQERPKYKQLLEHPFIKKSEQTMVNLQTWLDIVSGERRMYYPTNSFSFPSNNMRHSGRFYRSTTNPSSSFPSSSPSPGSSRSRYEDFALPNSPRAGTRADFHVLHSDSSSSLKTPSTPGTPSPNAPPDPPPRRSLQTPTNSSSSSSVNNLSSPSPTSISMANSSPSPDCPPPPVRRLRTMLLCYPNC
ncbi:unnamed protein product [Orchesella dallaii]|uniref:mitogen-activated protein kinase kinase n=1 Tax=Orchesella dallaii TaxID=48710 RepID=A0ABP1QBI4_9HEXA